MLSRCCSTGVVKRRALTDRIGGNERNEKYPALVSADPIGQRKSAGYCRPTRRTCHRAALCAPRLRGSVVKP